tara:strand:+ start:936 stop:2087 length:1152 start_codon:yes stop_codon:yes gene_type:complete
MKKLFIYVVAALATFFCIRWLTDSPATESLPIGQQVGPAKLYQNAKSPQTPTNIILLIGDGMGPNHTALGRFVLGGPDFNMAVDRMPISGTATNHSFDDLYTDSAASATAWATGTKTKNRYVGVDPEGKLLINISEILNPKSIRLGIVATSSLTHATPAAHYAHVQSRYEEKEIARQLIHSNINIALGGGTKFFQALEGDSQAISFIDNLNQLDDVVMNQDRVIGLFAEKGIERGQGPSQLQMTKAAIKYLQNSSNSCNGFFLMSEGSQIDWASHDNKVHDMLVELEDFNASVNFVLDLAKQSGDTLVIVSSDHETGGLNLIKQNESEIEISWTNGKHTLTPISVYAYGPGAELFQGKIDQTDIFVNIINLFNQNLANQCLQR